MESVTTFSSFECAMAFQLKIEESNKSRFSFSIILLQWINSSSDKFSKFSVCFFPRPILSCFLLAARHVIPTLFGPTTSFDVNIRTMILLVRSSATRNTWSKRKSRLQLLKPLKEFILFCDLTRPRKIKNRGNSRNGQIAIEFLDSSISR